MNIPLPVVGVFLTAIVGLQAWTLLSVHNLAIKVAVLSQRLDDQKYE